MDKIIKVMPQWEGVVIRRESEMIRSATLPFDIYHADGSPIDLVEAEDALGWLSLPVIFGNLFRSHATTEQIAPSKCEGIVEYEYKNTDEFTFSFETTGGTQHLTQSYQTVGRFAPFGRIAPNHHGAIGVNDREITGCEVIMPTLSFSMNRTKTGILDMEFIGFLAGMTGKINGEPFMGFFPGEVLFEGASGSQKFTETDFPTFDLTYKFRVSLNASNLSVGNINVGYKHGWDYFWVQYEEYSEIGSVSKRPIAAFIERVYHIADLNLLL